MKLILLTFPPNYIIICNCKLFIAEEIIAPSLDNKSKHISDLLLGKAMCIIGGYCIEALAVALILLLCHTMGVAHFLM